MVKKFQKNNLKQKRKFTYRMPTLWDILDEKSKDVLLKFKANAIKSGNTNYAKHKNKAREKRAYTT